MENFIFLEASSKRLPWMIFTALISVSDPLLRIFFFLPWIFQYTFFNDSGQQMGTDYPE